MQDKTEKHERMYTEEDLTIPPPTNEDLTETVEPTSAPLTLPYDVQTELQMVQRTVKYLCLRAKSIEKRIEMLEKDKSQEKKPKKEILDRDMFLMLCTKDLTQLLTNITQTEKEETTEEIEN